MVWQDIAIAIAQGTFVVALVPAIRKHSVLPLATTATSVLASSLILMAVISLGLTLSAVMGVIKTSFWAILALQSYHATKR